MAKRVRLIKPDDKPAKRIKYPPGYNVTDPKKPRVILRGAEFSPHFCFKTRAHAERVLEENAKRAGLRLSSLTVLENEGRFAIAPVWRKGMPIPQFKKGETVYGLFMVDSEAKIVEAGAEQSIIRYVKESDVKMRPKQECVPNGYLWRPSQVNAPKRERL